MPTSSMPKPEHTRLAALTAAALLLPLGAGATDRVRCHRGYGGEARTIEVQAASSETVPDAAVKSLEHLLAEQYDLRRLVALPKAPDGSAYSFQHRSSQGF